MAPRISVRTLGRVRIEVGRRTIGPSAGQLLALLLYLTSRRGQATSRRELQELFFPGAEEHQAGHSLRQLLYRLRQLSVPFAADADGVGIAEQDVWVDWVDLLERGELGTPDLEMVAQGLFPGYSPDISEGYREWFESERGAVRLRLSRAVGLQLTQLRGAGRWDLVDVASRALLALDPLCEDGMIARAQALFASGSKTAALKVIDDYLAELGDDQPNLRLTPAALRRRISERLPEMGHRAHDDRIFVGREDAMQMLSAAGAAARAGAQQTVLVWGEPGIGKTRLLAEYKALACLQGALVFQATCQPHDVFRPLGILSDLVGQLLQAPGALGCDPEGRELLTRLVTSSAGPQHQTEQHRGESSLAAIISSLDDLLGAVSSEHALVILIDDAQWLDRESLKALLGVISSKVTRRSWVVLGSRERAILTNNEGLADNVVSIRLYPLDHASALELARSLLGREQSRALGQYEQQILREGRGIPYFIRLLCRHVAAGDESTTLGQTVAEALKRRLEQLSPTATRSLQAAVVLGKNCTYSRLARMLELGRFELLRAVEELDDRGLIEVADGRLVTCHALLAETIEARMSTSVKRALHISAAELLQEEFEPSEPGSLPWDCAEHWRLADDHRQAIKVLRSCATRAVDLGRPTDAFATLKRALTMNAPDALRLELVESALDLLWLGVNWAEASDLLPERKRLRATLGLPSDPHDNYESLEYGAFVQGDLGDPRRNIPALRRCIVAKEADSQHRLAAARHLLMIAELTLDADLAAVAFRASRSLEADSARQMLCDLLYHTCFGDAGTAAKIAEALVAFAVEDHPTQVVWLLNAGYAQYRIGSSDTAEATLQRGLEGSRRYRSLSREMEASLLLARLYWSNERFADSQYWHRHYSELQKRNDDQHVLGEHSVLGARLALRDHDVELAKWYLDRAKTHDHAKLDLPRLFLKAADIELLVASGSTELLSGYLDEALDLYSRARNIGCQDDVVLSLLKAQELLGRHGQATALLGEYVGRYRRDGFSVPTALRAACDRLGFTKLPHADR